MIVVGIDPGTRGAIAVLDEAGVVFMAREFYPDMPAPLLAAWIGEALTFGPVKGVFLEKVGHKKGDGARGSFTFGGALRLVEGVLLGRGIKPRYVPPAFWQARMECLTAGNKKVAFKRARFLFSNQVRVTKNVADALLLAEYGRRCLA